MIDKYKTHRGRFLIVLQAGTESRWLLSRKKLYARDLQSITLQALKQHFRESQGAAAWRCQPEHRIIKDQPHF
jgi:hypothetical protein